MIIHFIIQPKTLNQAQNLLEYKNLTVIGHQSRG